jgi:hypothetical protein
MHAFAFLIPLLLAGDVNPEGPTVIVVVGAPGNEEYGQKFSQWADNWEAAANEARAKFVRIGHRADQ